MNSIVIALLIVAVFGIVLAFVEHVRRSKSIIKKIVSIACAISLFIGAFVLYKEASLLNLDFLKLDFKIFDFKLVDIKNFDIKEIDFKNLSNSKFSFVSKLVLVLALIFVSLFIIFKIFVFAIAKLNSSFTYTKKEGEELVTPVYYDINVIPDNVVFAISSFLTNIKERLTGVKLAFSFTFNKEGVLAW